jgi:hypothetical protein
MFDIVFNKYKFLYNIFFILDMKIHGCALIRHDIFFVTSYVCPQI